MIQPMAQREMAHEFSGFFENAAQGRLCFPHCATCNRFHWYPMPLCPHCRNRDVRWQEIPGRGDLFSWTVVRHPFDPRLAELVPYVVGLVTFAQAPGIRLVTTIVDAAPAILRIGMAVEPVFHATPLRAAFPDSGSQLCFRPVGDTPQADAK